MRTSFTATVGPPLSIEPLLDYPRVVETPPGTVSCPDCGKQRIPAQVVATVIPGDDGRDHMATIVCHAHDCAKL